MAANRILAGDEFKKRVEGPFYKVLNVESQHRGFRYLEGHGYVYHPNTILKNKLGGIEFTNEQNLAYHVYGDTTLLGYVQIPSDARVYKEGNRYKTNKLTITKIIPMSESKLWADPIWSSRAVGQNPHVLQYIQEPTYELCQKAVSLNGQALQYVPRDHKTRELCEPFISYGPGSEYTLAYYVPQEYKTPGIRHQIIDICESAMCYAPQIALVMLLLALSME